MKYYYYIFENYRNDSWVEYVGTNRKKAINEIEQRWNCLSSHDRNAHSEYWLGCCKYKLAKDGSNYDKVFESARNIYDRIRFDNLATYMNDEIREELHFSFLGNAKEFLREYLKKDPEFIDIVRIEFGDIYDELYRR